MFAEASKKNENNIDPTPFWKRRRYFVVMMAFLGLFNVYALRVNLSVAIVAMTENRTVTHNNGSVTYEQYFKWNSAEKGYILSSFFYGYLVTQVVGGVVATKIGGNILFGIGVGMTAILTILTPFAANCSLGMMITVRIIEGLFEGVTYSSLYEMWSKWSPPFERSRMVVAAFTGNYIGIVVSLPISGLLASTWGWPWIFYVFGIIGCIWTVLWLTLVKRAPAYDPFISKGERNYIEQALRHQTINTKVKTPWKAIWTSKAVWAIIAAQFSEGWGFFTLQTQLPQFLKDVLKFEIAKSGFVSAVPYVAMSFMLQVAGFLSDWVRIKGYLTTRQTRRYFNCLAFVGQAACMLLAAFFLQPAASVTFITIGVTFAAFAYSSFTVNYLDIAPQFAGVLMGICNSFATAAGIVSPILTGYIVTTPTDSEWKIIFFIASGIYLFGMVVYWFWAQGEVQPWAIPQGDTCNIDNSKKDDIQLGIANPTFRFKS